MKKISSLIVLAASIFAVILASCNTATKETADATDSIVADTTPSAPAAKLEMKWESKPELKVPESVCYDAAKNVLYVSNIDGKHDEKDGKGFISILSMEGEIVNLEWVKGLDAPKGMGIFGGKLYVSDINQVVEIDIEKAKIIKKYKATGAQFLNDIAIDAEGNVYISDMQANKIYRLSNGKIEVWLDDPQIQSPNGLFVEDGKLLIGTNAVFAVNIADKQITLMIGDTGGIDGLESDGNGNYLISDWTGNVHLVATDKEKIKLLDPTPQNINAADFDFIKETQLLFIPTFSDNRVIAYKLTVE